MQLAPVNRPFENEASHRYPTGQEPSEIHPERGIHAGCPLTMT